MDEWGTLEKNIKPARIKIKIFNNLYTIRKKIETKEVEEKVKSKKIGQLQLSLNRIKLFT